MGVGFSVGRPATEYGLVVQRENTGMAFRERGFDSLPVHEWGCSCNGNTARSHRANRGSTPRISTTGRHVPRRRAALAMRLRRVRFSSCPRMVFARTTLACILPWYGSSEGSIPSAGSKSAATSLRETGTIAPCRLYPWAGSFRVRSTVGRWTLDPAMRVRLLHPEQHTRRASR